MANPAFKTPHPYPHQLVAFERFKDAAYAAVFFEQRLGKAATALALAAHKYHAGQIDSLLIVAPLGVDHQWVIDAIPEHLIDSTNYRAVLWRSSKIKQVTVRNQLKELLSHSGLRILAINIDAIFRKEFSDKTTGYAQFFFKGHRVMTVIDESSDIASDAAKRTRAAIKLGRASRARVILDGTPASTGGPLGLYSQCNFLAPGALGFTSFVTFKAHYAELERRDFGERTRKCPDCGATGWVSSSVVGNNDTETRCSRCYGTGVVGKIEAQLVKTRIDPDTGDSVKAYRNLDELKTRLDAFSVRLLRADCYSLPPKIYNKLYFELEGEQRRVYEDLREKFRAELRSGTVVTAAMALTRFLRLQQVSSGFLPTEATLIPCPACFGFNHLEGAENCPECEGVAWVLDDAVPTVEALPTNPRLALFLDQLAKLSGPGIVWCHFNHDVDAVVAGARAAGKRVVQYDGRVTASAKAEAVALFQGGQADLFVAKPRSAGRGHDLARADWVLYYSHGWSLRMRQQSEDRAQSLSKTSAVSYLDIVCVDSIDVRIVTALRSGKQLSDQITGDAIAEWI